MPRVISTVDTFATFAKKIKINGGYLGKRSNDFQVRINSG